VVSPYPPDPRPLAEPGWFHGGIGGLAVGDWLLPPAVTGAMSHPQLHQEYLGIDVYAEGMEADRNDPARTFLTRDPRLAWGHAVMYALAKRGPCGGVYEAEPEDPEPDPDMSPSWAGVFCQAPRARITRVLHARVRPQWRGRGRQSPGQAEAIITAYTQLADGTPITVAQHRAMARAVLEDYQSRITVRPGGGFSVVRPQNGTIRRNGRRRR
jgi:hypothetical protein